jgi:hypothetical protein
MDQLSPKRDDAQLKLHSTLAAALCTAAFAAAAIVLIRFALPLGRGAFDEINYHKPAIRTFAEQWPNIVLSDYLSATTPGYHLLLALAAKVFGGSDWVLRVANLAISLVLINALARWVGHGMVRREVLPALAHSRGTLMPTRMKENLIAVLPTIAVMLPFAASMHVLFPAVWMLPDNAGWLGVALIMMLTLREKFTARHLLLAGGVLATLAFMRQIHVWAAAPILVVACLMGVRARDGRAVPEQLTTLDDLKRVVFLLVPACVRRAPFALIAAAPAAAVVAFFVKLWGGLVPPTFQGQYHEPNLAAPAFVLSLFGVFGLFFVVWLMPTVRGLIASRLGVVWLIGGAAAGFALACVAPTTYSVPDGRFSGLWNLVKACDSRGLVIFGRTSPVIVGCTTIGGVILAGMLAMIGWRRGLVMLGAIVAFTAAQAASFQLWQRYNEPFVLMAIAMMIAVRREGRDVHSVPPSTTPRTTSMIWSLRLCGPVLLAALLGIYAALVIRSATPAEFFDLKPGEERTKKFIQGEETP